MPLLSVLLDMEFTGMYIDAKILSKMSSDLGKKIDQLKNLMNFKDKLIKKISKRIQREYKSFYFLSKSTITID